MELGGSSGREDGGWGENGPLGLHQRDYQMKII